MDSKPAYPRYRIAVKGAPRIQKASKGCGEQLTIYTIK